MFWYLFRRLRNPLEKKIVIVAGNKRSMNCFRVLPRGSDKGDNLVKGIVTAKYLILKTKERLLNLVKFENNLETKPYKKAPVLITSLILFLLFLPLCPKCLRHTQRTAS